MYTYPADSFALQEYAGLAFFRWLSCRLAARHARLTQETAVLFFRGLGPHALSDIGIEVITRDEPVARLHFLGQQVSGQPGFQGSGGAP